MKLSYVPGSSLRCSLEIYYKYIICMCVNVYLNSVCNLNVPHSGISRNSHIQGFWGSLAWLREFAWLAWLSGSLGLAFQTSRFSILQYCTYTKSSFVMQADGTVQIAVYLIKYFLSGKYKNLPITRQYCYKWICFIVISNYLDKPC